jgi:hypothetical protein
MSTVTNKTTNNKSTWVDLVWYLSDIAYLTEEKLLKYIKNYGSIVIASLQDRPNNLPNNVFWYCYKQEQSKASVWNKLLEKGEHNWKLYLMDDEILRIEELDMNIADNPKEWPATLIHHRGSEKNNQYYQMRLIHNFDGFKFDGVNIPDTTRSIINEGISISNVPIEIMASKNPNADIDIEEEMAIQNYAPQLFLENGYRLFKKGKFIHAAAQYRVLANAEKVLPFDRLSALNGIASCHAEQFRWEYALLAANKSLEEESFQHLPYLVKFKVNQLNKNYVEAYKALNKYYENTFYTRIKLHSKANYDVRITIEDTLISLIDLAFKAGYVQKAQEHLEELFDQKEGKLEKEFLMQLLVLCIELEDFDKSEFFFKELYAKKIPKNLTEKELSFLNDYMELFMKKNWYEMPYEVYSELYYHYPENDEFRRRLIVTLVKTGRVEQARNLASKVA